MPNYTLCLLLRSNLGEEERKKFLQDVEESLNSQNKPQITQWGKRALAYPIQKETAAFYYLVDFEGEPEIPLKLENKFKLEDKILRFLVVKRKAKGHSKKQKQKKEPRGKTATKETKSKKVKKATKEKGKK